MTGWELAVVSVLYAKAAWGYWSNNDAGMTIAFIAYAVANVGFIVKG